MSLSDKHEHSEEQDWAESASSHDQLPPDPLPPPRRRPVTTKTGRHCGKWWWLYLLLVIVAVVLIVIPVIFVALRNRVQDALNKSTVTVTHMTFQAPQPSQFDLAVNATVDNNSKNAQKATLSAFNASFYLPSIGVKKPFLYAEVPAQDTAQSLSLNIGDRSVYLPYPDSFDKFNEVLFTSEVFQFGLSGETHASVSGLPTYPITWDKMISLRGWNNFTGMNIHDLTVYPFNTAFDGATMVGKVDIPNPSVIEAQLGNVTMNTYTANGTHLGYVLFQYVDMLPGINTFDMRGWIDILKMISYVQDGQIDLKFTGNSSVNFIGERVPYFTTALQATTAYYTLNFTASETNSSAAR